MSDVTERLDRMEAKLRDMHTGGHVDDETFHKGLLVLAYEHVLLGDAEEAKRLVGGVSVEYAQNTLARHMGDDPAFHATVTALARFLDPIIPEVQEDEPEVAVVLVQKVQDQGLKN